MGIMNNIVDFNSWGTVEIKVAAVAIVFTSLLLSWISRRVGSRSRLRLPPGPRGFPIIGAIHHLRGLPHESFHELGKRYGPVMYLKLGAMPTLVVTNAAMAKEVLQTNDQVFASRPRLSIPSAISYDQQDLIFAPYGAHWRQLRKICNFELLAFHKLNQYSNIIKREISTTIHHILQDKVSSKTLDITKTLKGMTLNIITQMMWNKRHLNLTGENRFEEIFKKVIIISGSNSLIDFLPDFLPFAKPLIIKCLNFNNIGMVAHKELDKFIEEIICEREEDWAKNIRAKTGEEDFVDVLLKVTQEAGISHDINRDSMKATLTDMLLAGRDSSSTTMDWCLAELMMNPSLLKRAQDELTAVVGKDRMVNESDLPNLKFLDALIKETLRRRNPSPITIPHYSTSDSKIGGYDVPANTTLFVNFYSIHHDAAVWENPLVFDPDRFLKKDIDMGGRNFNYLPFGSGRRMCLGWNLASSILHLALAQLLHCIDWSLPDGQTKESVDVTEDSGLFLARKYPLTLVAKARLSHDAYSTA